VSDADPHDTRFSLPSIDDPPETEAGVILLGLDAERLVAGLGLARLADDAALVTQAVDQARHGVFGPDLGALVAEGVRTWWPLCRRLVAAPVSPVASSLRREWAHTARQIAAAVPELGPSSVVYLTACWLRRTEISQFAERRPGGKEAPDVLPELPAG
jgi:hypothetical protein